MAQTISTQRRPDGAVVVTFAIPGGATSTMTIPARQWPAYRDEFHLPEPEEGRDGDQ